jgi:hypothetical protein
MNCKKHLLVALLLFILAPMFAQSQGAKKLDKIIKRDYQIIECSITKISETTVEYSLPNETLVISLDLSQVAKIDYASGRSQSFDTNVATASSAANVSTNDTKSTTAKVNTIAVLPVPYVNSENMDSSEEMAKFAQNDIYSKLIDKSSNIFPLTVQDLRDTNSLLHKAGINYKNIDETPIADLHEILGVDNIIAAKVTYTLTQNQTSTGYTSGNAKVNDSNTKVKTQEVTTNSTQTQLVYNYHVYFDMYKNNSKIYTQSRKPILNVKDSWMDSIAYLLKRSPIYTK